jgi:hypothetical protein
VSRDFPRKDIAEGPKTWREFGAVGPLREDTIRMFIDLLDRCEKRRLLLILSQHNVIGHLNEVLKCGRFLCKHLVASEVLSNVEHLIVLLLAELKRLYCEAIFTLTSQNRQSR